MNKMPETFPNGGCQSEKLQQERKRKYIDGTPLKPKFPNVLPTIHNAKVEPSKKKCKSDGPTFMPLISIPDIGDCNGDSSLILKGTARRGPFGPSVGVVDIGISKVAYLFRVSLPGVKKDFSMFLLFLFTQVSFSSLLIVVDYLLEGGSYSIYQK